MTTLDLGASAASAHAGRQSAPPFFLGMLGALIWILGECLELFAPSSALIQPVAGAGIVLTALLPFSLLMCQGGRAWSAGYFGAFLMTTGAFALGSMDLIGMAPSMEQMAPQGAAVSLYDVGGAAYILGSLLFAVAGVVNGHHNRWLMGAIAGCALVIILMFAAGLPQRFASISNIVLAAVLIRLSLTALRSRPGRP